MIKKIAVLSDTHIPVQADDLSDRVWRMIEGADMVLHAGDLVAVRLLDRLETIAPVKAVQGNKDDEEVKRRLQSLLVFELAGIAWGMTHGTGSPAGIIERVQGMFLKGPPQIVVFGHTHQPLIEHRGQTVYFNPGSPTDTAYAPYRSIGFIETDHGSIRRMDIVCV
ncbi:MAG TPA: YfcE family phosphodiesterase [Atribacteraceae bacterium]|nr:YfcE family phosphodiesterase [Atribacteraceae bacterium]